MAKKKPETAVDDDENVLHARVSNKLIDGYKDVYLPVEGDKSPVGVKHDPEGQGELQFEKVRVKSTKGEMIPGWKLLYDKRKKAAHTEDEDESDLGEVN